MKRTLGPGRGTLRTEIGSLSYVEMADRLVPYVKENGFTHVQFLPVM